VHVLVVRTTQSQHERLAQAGQMSDAYFFVQAVQALDRRLHHSHPGDELLWIVLTWLVVVKGINDLRI